MFNIPQIIASIFLILASIYFIYGIYLLYINPKSTSNQVFFLLTLSMAIWDSAFSVVTIAESAEMANQWGAISSIGWTMFYTFLLHFTLIITNHHQLLKKKWIYLLIYVPGLINLYLYYFSPIADTYYNFVKGPLGYAMNMHPFGGNLSWFENIFVFYYVSFTLICMGLLLHFYFTTESEEQKKMSKNLLLGYFLALTIGVFFDNISLLTPGYAVPKFSTISFLIPITITLHSQSKKRILYPEIDIYKQGDIILSEFRRTQLYWYIGLFIIGAGILDYFTGFIMDGLAFSVVFLPAMIMIVAGTLIVVLQFIPVNLIFKDFVTMLIICVMELMTALRFADTAGFAVWAFPMALMMVFVLTNKQWIIVTMGAFVISLQIYIWHKTPFYTMEMTLTYYFVRIALFVMTLILFFYVIDVFNNRFKETEHRILYQKTISNVTTAFASVSTENIHSRISYLLEETGIYADADRAYVFMFDPTYQTMTYDYEWCREGIPSGMPIAAVLNSSDMPWWTSEVLEGRSIVISALYMLPEGTDFEREILLEQEIKSVVALPLMEKDKVIGFMGFDSVKKEIIWSNHHLDLLRVMSSILSDALKKIETEKILHRMAYYDSLTELPNRTYFQKNASDYLSILSPDNMILNGIMFLDIDSFKYINDTLGHAAGDIILRELAERLRVGIRPADQLARFGGDEFLILFKNIPDITDLMKYAQEIISQFNSPILLMDQEFFISTSMGISIYPYDGETIEKLIKNADIAMYESKAQGKNHYTLCSPKMKSDIQAKAEMTTYLYQALDLNQLHLVYQPQVELQNDTIIGFEALLRWNHPELGNVSPGTFIPITEQTALIVPIGKWVFETACIQLQKWHKEISPHLVMGINFSVRQLRDPELLSFLDTTTKRLGIDTQFIEIEVTESINIDENNEMLSILHGIKSLGFQISIDDFGVEYSSMSRLKILPVDRVKIDMSFIQGIPGNPKDMGITQTIIDMTKVLGLRVIAEGVEHVEQRDFLRDYGCHDVQGYYYYRPMMPEAIEDLATSSPQIDTVQTSPFML